MVGCSHMAATMWMSACQTFATARQMANQAKRTNPMTQCTEQTANSSNRSAATKPTDETTRETHLDNLRWLHEWLDEQALDASAESVRWAIEEVNR